MITSSESEIPKEQPNYRKGGTQNPPEKPVSPFLSS